jgi:addiction module RelE/StbE family toxin
MVKIVWTDYSLQDIEDIGEYIARDSVNSAKIVVRNLFKSVDLLAVHPLAGRIVPEFNNKNIRELIRGSYRIVYRIVTASRIDILTVHHSARLLTKARIRRRKEKP